MTSKVDETEVKMEPEQIDTDTVKPGCTRQLKNPKSIL